MNIIDKMNTSKQTVTGVELINAIKNIMKMLDETPEKITQEEMIEISDAIQKIEQIENKKKAEAPCVGCGDKEIAVTECGGETGVNMCAKCFGIETEEEDDEDDDVFCYGCGFTPCVEPEDPMDVRLCERCYKDSIAE